MGRASCSSCHKMYHLGSEVKRSENRNQGRRAPCLIMVLCALLPVRAHVPFCRRCRHALPCAGEHQLVQTTCGSARAREVGHASKARGSTGECSDLNPCSSRAYAHTLPSHTRTRPLPHTCMSVHAHTHTYNSARHSRGFWQTRRRGQPRRRTRRAERRRRRLRRQRSRHLG